MRCEVSAHGAEARGGSDLVVSAGSNVVVVALVVGFFVKHVAHNIFRGSASAAIKIGVSMRTAGLLYLVSVSQK